MNNNFRTALQYEPQALAERSGDRNFNGPRNIFRPKPIILATAVGLGEGPSYSTHVRMSVPDSRCRVKLSILFFPGQGLSRPPGLTGIGSIWVAAYDEDLDGIGGGAGRTVPITDLEGTSTSPTAFPKTDGLSGYSREFVTSADWIEADITIATAASVVGTWVLQSRIQPDAVSFGWEEWDQIRRLYVVQNNGGLGSL